MQRGGAAAEEGGCQCGGTGGDVGNVGVDEVEHGGGLQQDVV